MRQRNVSGAPLQIPDIPALVLPGDELDFDELLAGFEPVEDPPDGGKAKPSKTSDSSGDSKADDGKGGGGK